MINKTKNYWERRYKSGGNSGKGSYGIEHEFKTDYLNSLIKNYNIQTINDFGCGDGNQIKNILGYSQYNGFDISQTAVKNCQKKYEKNNKMRFYESLETIEPADLSMSLDVLYHIIEDELFYSYIDSLFKFSLKYVLVYSTNDKPNKPASHIVWRDFVDYIKSNYNVKLISITPFENKKDINNVSFYLFEKL
jgi:predicted TPR repeat methyltransferase